MIPAWPPRLRFPGVPIWLQIIALVVGGLVSAQVVTLGLTLLLPPAPPQQHSLAEIAQALQGHAANDDGQPLIRTVEAAPPSLDSPGWVVSPRTTVELAQTLHAPESDVRLLFYAPPPLAGTAPRAPRGPRLAVGGRPIVMAGFAPGPGGMGGGPPGGSMGGFGGMGPGNMGPGNMGPGQGMGQGVTGPGGFGPGGMGSGNPGASGGWNGAPPSSSHRPSGGKASTMSSAIRPAPTGSGDPPGGRQAGTDAATTGPGGRAARTAPPIPALRLPRSPLDAAIFDPGAALAAAPPSQATRTAAPAQASTPETSRPALAQAGLLKSAATAAPSTSVAAAAATPAASEPARPVVDAVGAPLAAPVTPTLFGFSRPSAYVEGEFVAALRTPAGWVTVRPKPEGFPNSWQRRVLLWFALSLALVAPPAFLLARRLVTPLQHFADAAERLGRDPTADLPPLAGPAEIGRAASAFNLMRLRLRRYVEDRTGMISAITHDLRTPLARMRFKLERTPPAVRASLARDVDQMEAMIASVLSFMRDELSGSPRETADLRSILECVVDEAGGQAELEAGPSVAAHVDLLAIQRVFDNLVSNAIKYGGRAHVRMLSDGDDVLVEVADEGPGLSDDELEKVFQPFYRGAQARSSGAPGVGLGLAVSRSILRSHGGDLTLVSTEDGLTARARIPNASPLKRAA